MSERLCLGKTQRLRTPDQFQSIYKSRQWGNSEYFSFNVLAQNTVGKPAILGITVSKKVSKLAVDRNRIKRQIKEFFRLHQSQLSDSSLVITAKVNCLAASDYQRQQGLIDLWGKIMAWQRWSVRQKKIN